MVVLMIFGSKLLSLFSMSAFHSFLNKYLRYRQRQAMVTLKIHNSGLDRLCVTHFWPFSTLVCLGVDQYFGNHWAKSITHRYVKLRQQVLTVLQSRGENRLWLRFPKYTTIFTLCVDCVGQTYANLFEGHV